MVDIHDGPGRSYLEAIGKSKYLGGKGPYILVIVVLAAYCIRELASYFIFGWSWLTVRPLQETLSVGLSFAGLAYGIWAVRFLNRAYDRTTSHFKISLQNADMAPALDVGPSHRLRRRFLAMAVIGFTIYYALNSIRVVQDTSLIGDYTRSTWLTQGFLNVGFAVLELGIFVLILVDLFSVWIDIFSLPKRIIDRMRKVDILDPSKCGGLRPIGELALASSSVYFVGILMYNVLTAFAHFTPGTMAIFAGGWVLGCAFFVIPQLRVHRFMQGQKRLLMDEITRTLRDFEESWDSEALEGKDIQHHVRILHLYVRLNQVDRMGEFPFDARILKQVTLLALIPVATNILAYLLTKWFSL